MSWTILSLITDERSEARKGYVKCPISRFNQWPFCDSDPELSDSKAWAVNFYSILPTGYMQTNQAALEGTNGRTRNGLVPQHKWVCNTVVHLPQCYSVSNIILEESLKAIWATSQQFTNLFVNLNDLFLGEEAPDWTAGLPTVMQTGYVWINTIGSARAHTQTG